MTRRELAVELSKIDWARIQADDMHENEKLLELKCSLMQIKKKEEVVDLLLRVIEAKVLKLVYPESDSPFVGVLNFEFIKNANKEIKATAKKK
jgi:hypothetical protein